MMPGRVGRNVSARARQCLRHLVEDVHATPARLLERLSQDVHCDAAHLISICRSVMPAAVPAALKSMSPLVVFRTRDVGGHSPLAGLFVHHEAHRHTGHRALSGTRRPSSTSRHHTPDATEDDRLNGKKNSAACGRRKWEWGPHYLIDTDVLLCARLSAGTTIGHQKTMQ